MPANFTDRVYLAALGSEDVTAAFGEGYATATQPPAVSGLLRSLGDTHVWATRSTEVLATMERGDYVLFHRGWGVRCVAQVWATTADSDEVARHTQLADPAGEWGAVTLTNVQPALDHVALASIDAQDARQDRSLYQFPSVVADDLRAEFTTPARLVEELVADPLQFDVPPGGDPPDQRPEPSTPATSAHSADTSALPDPDGILGAQLDGLDNVRTAAWRVLGLGAFLLVATLAVAGRYRPPDGSPFVLTEAVAAGVSSLAVGAAIAAAIALQGAIEPRPGLGALASEYAGATRRASTTGSADGAAHLAARVESYCEFLATRTQRLGIAVATAATGVFVGNVLLAYGIGVQVSTSVRPLSVVPLAGFPLLVVLATAVLARRSLRAVFTDVTSSLTDAENASAHTLTDRLAGVKRAVAGLVERVR